MKNRGFTLVELIIAIGLFTIITTFALGAILGIYDANRRAKASKTVVDNLNLSLENMVRTVRFGNSYYCGESSSLTAVSNCPFGGNNLSATFENQRVIYRLNGATIQQSVGGGAYTNITSADTVIQYMRFYVFGTASDNYQPYVVAVIKGYVGNKPTAQSMFDIQTIMSQRSLDR